MGMGAELMKKIFESCKKINKKHRVLASVVLASVIIVGCISVKPTLAYFTTFASAKGGVSIDIGPTTRVKEKFKDWKKTIQIENTGKVDCFVRCKVIAASQFTITASGNNWSLSDDGYWYYSKVKDLGDTNYLGHKNFTVLKPEQEEDFEMNCDAGDIRVGFETERMPNEITIVGIQVSSKLNGS